ncbi:MAG: hypothetical protein Q9174_000832 [Haloplaca sp. 1 TL-2023]
MDQPPPHSSQAHTLEYTSKHPTSTFSSSLRVKSTSPSHNVMQTYRVRAIPRACRPLTAATVPHSVRGMSAFFPHLPSQTFAPFFRDLDSLFPSDSSAARSQTHIQSFTPRFDVRELSVAYELHGELPGILQEDIDIEFVDANTLVIKGKTERTSSRSIIGNGKEKAIEGAKESSPKTKASDNASEAASTGHHKASVEDDDYVDAGAEKEGQSSSAEAAPTATHAAAAEGQAAEEQAQYKYIFNERSHGHFSRTFSFPGKVDQEAVKASLKNGILSVVVPKAARQERKIAIE